MNPAIENLTSYLQQLEQIEEFDSLEAKAEHIGKINLIKNAIGQLHLCEMYGINSGSLVSVLPETENPNFCYLVVHENESSNPADWEEVRFDGRQVSLAGGDLIIRK
ncbi:hypothetical protein BTA51_13915 [Hahella sp. CCB-MM4]|uniref:hypothetical protein n=1 Tax=Hahella sp. (strain CCB-MM4) TaxID=1926491 RepID=UPI000B9AF3E7|nr:hypothetical protein [Hahella sp. CCB-MM4]OZG72621.1 hypothetical protein BTA51_13915 [Hahella sp. CCB-MM4]